MTGQAEASSRLYHLETTEGNGRLGAGYTVILIHNERQVKTKLMKHFGSSWLKCMRWFRLGFFEQNGFQGSLNKICNIPM